MEETSYYFPPKVLWRSFFSALVAAICLQYLNPLGSGKLVLFQVNYSVEYHYFEIVFFGVIGIIGGLLGALFIKLSREWRAKVTSIRVKYAAIYEVLIISIITSLTSYTTDFTMFMY